MSPDSLLQKWRPIIDQTSHIWSWTEPEVLALCAEIASHSRTMAELGTYLGRSAKVMLAANPQLRLLCVDTFQTAGIEHTCRHFLHEEITDFRCWLFVGDSHQLAEKTKFGGLTPYDAVWIDDGHAETDLVRDITSFLPLLKSGGTMFGHDWDGNNDVARGVKSVLPLKDLSFPHPRVWLYVKP